MGEGQGHRQLFSFNVNIVRVTTFEKAASTGCGFIAEPYAMEKSGGQKVSSVKIDSVRIRILFLQMKWGRNPNE